MRIPARLWARVLFVVSALLGVAGVLLSAAVERETGAEGVLTFAVGQALLGVGYPAVGALIAGRHPRNPCGWILITIGFLQSVSNAGYSYGAFATDVVTLGGAQAATWFSNWVWFPSLGLLATFLLLLFPDGRLPSGRWRPVAWLIAGFLVAGTAMAAVLA